MDLLPARFTDRRQRQWRLDLDYTLGKRIQSVAGLDFINAHDGKALLGVLQSDEKLVQTLWLFCEEQAQAASVDETEFGRGLDGPTLEQAINALEECVLNFCRPARRTAIQAVREKAREVEAAQAELVAAKVRSPALAQAMAAKMAEVSRDIDQRMAKAIATSGDSATDSRASPASIPVPTRCGS
jgi:hypothetical protein